MSRPSLQWYVRRLRRMSAAELSWRSRDQVRRVVWSTRQVRPGQAPNDPLPALPRRRFTAVLPAGAERAVGDEARRAVIDAADQILAGRLNVLGVLRTDLAAPDWFLDPVSGRRSTPGTYAFRVNHRSESETGNVKQVWELSRHHHLTLLATAWLLTKDEAYAQRVSEQLRSWWQVNSFLSGIHWTSGIEVGIRLISWTWIRRLLDDWPRVTELFDDNELALRQLHWHQQYLAGFASHGSSANNHVIAEAAGRLVAASAFPWFPESGRWRSDAAELLERELEHNTFATGVNRELASDYHRFVAELGLLAAVEARIAGAPLGSQTWQLLAGMLDSAAALVDASGRPPRQGDGDEGQALVLDPADPSHWFALLALGDAVLGRAAWWPRASPDARSVLMGALAGRQPPVERRQRHRPSHFPDAGVTLLRTSAGLRPEIWCRCDGGPHGFLAIAAHAHADALSVEVRLGGVDVLADPGTYCYHGDESWRAYFRSTIAHNTVELDGRDQSTSGGPFLWSRHANAELIQVATDDEDDTATWCAQHDGYLSLSTPSHHRRTVRLDRPERRLHITDHIDGTHDIRMAYHLGPTVDAELDGSSAGLCWGDGKATMELPTGLRWTAHRGEIDPILGWYSPRFGHRVPATTLLGTGRTPAGGALTTHLEIG